MFQSIWQHKAKLHTYRKPTPSATSTAQPHMAMIIFLLLALDIPALLSQLWDTTAPTPKPSVNSIPYQQTLANRLESMSPTNTSTHPTENASVQSTQNVTIPLLPSRPAVITRSVCQSKFPSKFSDSAHSSFLSYCLNNLNRFNTFSRQMLNHNQHIIVLPLSVTISMDSLDQTQTTWGCMKQWNNLIDCNSLQLCRKIWKITSFASIGN